MTGLTISGGIKYLSVVCVWDYWLRLYWGRKSQKGVFVSEPTSLSVVTVLVTIPFVKESIVAKKRLAQWHWKGIWVFFKVIGIFLIARLTTCHEKSIIYAMSLGVIREAIIIVTKFDGVKVY